MEHQYKSPKYKIHRNRGVKKSKNKQTTEDSRSVSYTMFFVMEIYVLYTILKFQISSYFCENIC